MGHSQGCIHIRNAIWTYDENRAKSIVFVAIAPGGYTPPGRYHSVKYFRSSRNFVPLFDHVGRMQCLLNTTVLEPHPDAPLIDHDFRSPTYAEAISLEVNKFIQNNGIFE